MENRNEIIERIHLAMLEAHQQENVMSRSEWTNIFKGKLKEIGLGLRYKVYSSITTPNNSITDKCGEYLLDLTWSIENIDNDNDWKIKYKGLSLACEIEWNMNQDDIIYDFQKLAVVKADIKLMIVQFNIASDFERIKEACESSVDRTLWDDGSTYILCGSQNGEKEKLMFVRLWKI